MLFCSDRCLYPKKIIHWPGGGLDLHPHSELENFHLETSIASKSLFESFRTTKLAQGTSQYYFVLQSLHKKYLQVLLCTEMLAQSTSQYYFVLQSLHQSTSQYYFVLQSLHKKLPYYFVLHGLQKVFPSTTLYYKACTRQVPVRLCTTKLSKYFPVLFGTTKLARGTSQYHFVLQSLHTVIPSTTFYYKACTKYFPVLLCTTKLSSSTSQYYFVRQSLRKAQGTPQYYFVLQSLHKVPPSTTLYYRACTQ